MRGGAQAKLESTLVEGEGAFLERRKGTLSHTGRAHLRELSEGEEKRKRFFQGKKGAP